MFQERKSDQLCQILLMSEERLGLKIGFSNVVTIGDFGRLWWSSGGKMLIKVVEENVRRNSGYGDIRGWWFISAKYKYKTRQNSQNKLSGHWKQNSD